METANLAAPESLFERRLRTAVSAGAWLLLVPAGLLLLQWIVYLAIVSSQPAWFLRMLGPDVDWSDVQALWLRGMVSFKVLFWAHLLLVLWGALWSSMLRKEAARRAPEEPKPVLQPRPAT